MRTILIVEDFLDLRGELARLFTSAGWKVWRAADLAEARERIADMGAPAVILADRRLRTYSGTVEDGADLLDLGIPLVIYSADDAAVPGALVVLKKPTERLVRRVEGALDIEVKGAVCAW